MKKIAYILVSMLFLYSCKTTKKTPIDTNTITLEIKSNSDLKINNATATIIIYGYDKLLADVSATIIVKKEIALSKIPASVTLKIPNNPENVISPKITSKENAMYYVSFYCDANTNNKEDKGDLVIDFNKKFPSILLDSDKKQPIYVRAK